MGVAARGRNRPLLKGGESRIGGHSESILDEHVTDRINDLDLVKLELETSGGGRVTRNGRRWSTPRRVIDLLSVTHSRKKRLLV